MSTETQNTPAPTKTEATPTGEAKPFRSAALYVSSRICFHVFESTHFLMSSQVRWRSSSGSQ